MLSALPEPTARRHRLLLAALLVSLLAGAVRLAHVSALERNLSHTHLFSTGRLDAADHLREAREILTKDPWLRDRVQWKGPGYSYFLAGLMWLAGPDPGRLRWLVAALGAVNCGGLVLLARRFLGLPASILAGLLAATNGIVILYDGELYFPTVLVAVSLPMLALLLRGGGTWSYALAGSLLGLAVLVHPVYLLVGAAVATWLVRSRAARVIPFLLGAALTVAPVTAKHLIFRGQLVPIAWSGGINLYLGNQPGYDQLSGQGTQAWDRVYLSPVDAGIEREADRDRLYYRLAARQFVFAPLTAVVLFLDKARIFFSPLEIANNVQLYELRDYSPVLRATLGRLGPIYYPFGLWAPLAWLGAWLLARRQARGHGLMLLCGAAIGLSCVLFFNTARYRVPLVFLSSIWVALTLETGWTLWRQRQWRSLLRGSAVVLSLSLLTALIHRPQRTLPPPLELTEAQVLEQMKSYEEAGRMFGEVCRRHADDPALLLSCAGFHARRGDQDARREFLRRVLQLPDLGPDDLSNTNEQLAESYLLEGRLDEAEAAFHAALAVHVDDSTWHGVPFFRMGLGPVTDCRLRLGLAEVRLAERDAAGARALVDEVLAACGAHGRIEARLKKIEPVLKASRFWGARPPAAPR